MATQMNVIELTRAIEAATERFAHTDAQASDHERKELVAACAKLQKAVDAPANAGRRAMYAVCLLAEVGYSMHSLMMALLRCWSRRRYGLRWIWECLTPLPRSRASH